jgi:hypothetical protein
MSSPQQPTKKKTPPRLVLDLSEEQKTIFTEACEKEFPGASYSYVLKRLIEAFCKKAGVKWVKDE